MKLIKQLITLAILPGTILFTQTASAYLQLTYNSNPLPFLQGYLGYEPYDDIGSNEPPYPSFSVNFSDTAGNTATQSLAGPAIINVIDWPYLLESIPVTGGNITLGESGIPTAWNFSMEVTQSSPGYTIGEDTPLDEFKLPSRTTWWFESNHGANTCNCDRYKYEDDLYIERPYNSWIYANTIGFLFGETNSPNNWTINKVDVPEPKTYLLFLLGLMAIGVTRMRNRDAI